MRLDPKAVRIVTKPGAASFTDPDDRGLRAARIAPHGGQHVIGVLRRDDRDQLSFVRDIKRIETQQFTGAADLLAHWNAVLLDLDAHSRLLPQFR